VGPVKSVILSGALDRALVLRAMALDGMIAEQCIPFLVMPFSTTMQPDLKGTDF
jgi:hypothetical protein